MGAWRLYWGTTSPELNLVGGKEGRELSGLKQSSWRGGGRATGYLLQDKILFGGSRLCHREVAQKSLHLYQVGQLVNEDICQERTELRPQGGREGRTERGQDKGARAREAAWQGQGSVGHWQSDPRGSQEVDLQMQALQLLAC